ncbi:hypothetical protein AOQ84DRAFT_176888 [Glonium stellatum]|uniref:Uncharacterized protein n=1 Tax=Glonium stellatum TaxID=574774 RepID=A0A8E2EPQ1_9PEZI|nr:hypothetical protein AOQ84DRAFT_176888 [Glonium stellatum]
MSLTVKALNGDTSFLLTFSPPIAPVSPPSLFPGSFTILIDPWLSGAAQILSPKFSITECKTQPCISSLKELDEEPDIVLISQDKPDHCHQETLSAKKIRGWKHFEPSRIHALTKYTEENQNSIYRLILPPFSPRASPGEVTIALMPAKRDISGLHNAIGITYRPPCSVLSALPGSYLDLPPTPPASPGSPRTISSTPRTIVPSPYHDREKTLSVIYSPHGVSYGIIRPYASSHLVSEAALPLSLLIHSFDRVENPWYLGGNIAAGSPGGLEIVRNLLAKSWISAHDAEKLNKGLSVMQMRMRKFGVKEIKKMLREGSQTSGPRLSDHTEMLFCMAHVGIFQGVARLPAGK